jgi:methanol--5-hydroxybenzimidazolylcobamide Co-methyltransferase
MTYNPTWGEEIVRIQRDILEHYHDEYGIRCALRATIGDVRTAEDGLRTGKSYSNVIESFERAAKHVDLLSIESIGGKEVFNHALIRSDVKGVIFAVAVLACEDMRFLWKDIVAIADKAKVIAAGDSDCAHSNTAMQLAGGMLGKELPHTMAAFVRALGASRSLVAYEQGARGPGKDCGFENVIVKAVTGCPMSFEGKSSACADSTLMGNIAAAACDLWSNESVQQGELFGGTTPQVFTEILGYDCALFNAATKLGNQMELRDALVASDKYRDPQSLVLAPDSACSIGNAIVSEADNYYLRGLKAGQEALEIIDTACESNMLRISSLELKFLGTLEREARAMPAEESSFIEEMIKTYSSSAAGFSTRNYDM